MESGVLNECSIILLGFIVMPDYPSWYRRLRSGAAIGWRGKFKIAIEELGGHASNTT